ncbi:MAG: cell envelope integrity protein CreD [Burkholderiaceae bacterium]
MFKHRGNPLLLKALILGILAISLLIPLEMIEGLIAERASRRIEAVHSVQASFAGAQTVVLPFFVWPYTEHWTETATDANGRVIRTTQMSEAKNLLWFAGQLQSDVQVTVQNDRYRGIHRVRTFDSKMNISGTFLWPDRDAVKPSAEGRRIEWGEPRLVLPISDVRGLRGTPALTIGGDQRAFREATQLHLLPAGIHSTLSPAPANSSSRFAIELGVAGTEHLAFAPTAASSVVTMKSPWPDPHFGGRYLPVDRTVSAEGFTARWEVSALASAVQQQLRSITSTPRSDRERGAAIDTFEVGFIEAVNTYLLAERSAKHGALIIAMVFAALFLFDTLRGLDAHPIQYGFVGLALVIFFLLLLSLSEHIAFGIAYLIAAIACTVLITYYLQYVLGDFRRACSFGAALTLVYAATYAILVSEGTALLMGSLLLFALLAAAMVVTRKFDWRKVPHVTAPG